jgi:hypothetical protein
VDEQPIALASDRGKSLDPRCMVGPEASQVSGLPPVELPESARIRLGSPTPNEPEPPRREQPEVVVPEQAPNRPLAFESHDELDDSDPVRPAVDEIAEQPQARVPPRPAQVSIDKFCVAQQIDKGVEAAVDIADDERRHYRADSS